MILRRFYDERLAQTSYLIGCSATGQALVIDANRDLAPYLEAARAEGVRITHASETHIHADFVSGTRELAARTGAQVYLSGEGGAEWQYGYRSDANVKLVLEGDQFEVGNVLIQVRHTPGHTPEHIVFFVTDRAAADRPIGVVTGDFVFVGDVGRPDLLERAAHMAGTMESSARDLFRSLQRFKKEPDYLQIWPGHGAGSACGKGLSSIPHSTVGYEKLFNWAFAHEDEDTFVTTVLEGQPEAPRYFAEMKRINRDGPALLNGFPEPPQLSTSALSLPVNAILIDTRRPDQFARRHVPGSLNIPLDRSFNTWAGWLVDYGRDIYLLVDARLPRAVPEATRALAMIGLDRVAGYFTDDVLPQWAEQGGALESLAQIRSAELHERLGQNDLHVLDVRGYNEWVAGHIPQVQNIPLGYLMDHLGGLPRETPLVVQCQSGTRSAIAASLLQAHGFRNIVNLVGGFGEWQRQGYPVEREDRAGAEV